MATLDLRFDSGRHLLTGLKQANRLRDVNLAFSLSSPVCLSGPVSSALWECDVYITYETEWPAARSSSSNCCHTGFVVGELLGDLVNRGLDFSEPRLYVLDGRKALHTAVRKYAGESAPIQRCQVHKRRNVLDHLTDEQKPSVAKKLNAAYALEDHAAAKLALTQLHRELMDLNPSTARSLEEGLEETLTVHRLS